MELTQNIDEDISTEYIALREAQRDLESIRKKKMLGRQHNDNEIGKVFDEFAYEVYWINTRVTNTITLLKEKHIPNNNLRKCYGSYIEKLYKIFDKLGDLDIDDFRLLKIDEIKDNISELEKNIDALFMKFYPKQIQKNELKKEEEEQEPPPLFELAFYNVLEGREIVKKIQYYITFLKLLGNTIESNKWRFVTELYTDYEIITRLDSKKIPRFTEIKMASKSDDNNHIIIIRLKIEATRLLEELEVLYDNLYAHMNNPNPNQNNTLVDDDDDIYKQILLKKEELMKILENIDNNWVGKPRMTYELLSYLLNEIRYIAISSSRECAPCTFQKFGSIWLQEANQENRDYYNNAYEEAQEKGCFMLKADQEYAGGASKVVVKRTLNPYNKYVAKQFPSMKKKFPNEKASEIMKKIAIEWNKTKNK